MHNFNTDAGLTETHQEDLLNDIDVRCHTNVASLREATSRQTRIRMDVRAANACDRVDLLTSFTTSEINDHGLSGIAPTPVMVGSVFHLEFDRQKLNLSPLLAVCDRCTMLGESSFDLRFRFTQPVDLGNS